MIDSHQVYVMRDYGLILFSQFQFHGDELLPGFIRVAPYTPGGVRLEAIHDWRSGQGIDDADLQIRSAGPRAILRGQLPSITSWAFNSFPQPR